MVVQGQPGQIVLKTPISKITRAKWTGGVTRAGKHLLGKFKALSSNPSPTKNKNLNLKKKKKKRIQECTNIFLK
jgi:hypothetical protein